MAQIEDLRRRHKWAATQIAFDLSQTGTAVSRRTVSRHLAELGLNRRRFIDPNGDSNREPRQIITCRPGHMTHVDVKKAGRIPDGRGRRVHERDSDHAQAIARSKEKSERGSYLYLHSAVDGSSGS